MFGILKFIWLVGRCDELTDEQRVELARRV